MASSNVKMEGTKLIEEATLTITFRKVTRWRLLIAILLLKLADYVAPLQIVMGNESEKSRKVTRARHQDLIEQ
jgi:hypothetical protein